jgi:flagellar hook-associated protein 3 FlgL
MSNIVPIPNTRISDLFASQRLVQQFQNDQLDLFRLQDQISTGQRITLPSDDPSAALRAITLQRILERKDQLQINVQTGQSFLAATDSALSDVASMLGDLRGSVLGVAGTASTQQQRDAVIEEINQALEQLVQTGNKKFRGRYLFAGSQTSTEPYQLANGLVEYLGNEKETYSYSDLNVLFASNTPGTTVFGGISAAVRGSADLTPQTNTDTLLANLRGGQGISPYGALQISDGTGSSVVDISTASTLGDVARLIEENPPTGRQVTVTVTGQGLTLQLDLAGGGNLTVTEVGSGSAAKELGILEKSGVLPPLPLVGADLNPVLEQTSRLDDLLGTKATAKLDSAGANNDIRFRASSNGTQQSGVTIQIVDDDLLQAAPGISAGSEYAQFDPAARAAVAAVKFPGANNDLILTANTAGNSFNQVRIDVTSTTAQGAPTASYDPVGKVLTINLESDGSSNANQVIAAVAAIGGNPFTATLDTSGELNTGMGTIATINQSDYANTGNSGGDAGTLYIYIEPGATTANQVIAAVDAEGTFIAELDAHDSLSTITAGTGHIGTDATAVTSGGSGTALDLNSGIQIVNGNQSHTLDFSSAITVEDLTNIINGAEAGLHAEINAAGTGLDIRSRTSGTDFQIGENGGQLATLLGIRTLTGQTYLNDLNYGVGVPTRTGNDFMITSQDTAGVDVDLSIDISAATTLGDVIDLINAHPNNNAGGVSLEARLASTGNGIELFDANRTGAPPTITVSATEGSLAAEYLGLIPAGATQTSTTTDRLTGQDRYYQETDSVFTTLIRLRETLQANDIEALERAIAMIDNDIDRVSFARAEAGARQQGLELATANLQDEEIQLRSALSDEIDVDLVEAISAFTARQTSLEASLRASASMLQLSLLDFL